MSTVIRTASVVTALVAALAGTFTAVPAAAEESSSVAVRDYDVFVDLPTAFAFVKMPTGWKFVGKLDADQLRRLPQGTITSLLPADADSVQLAAEAAKSTPRKRGAMRSDS